MEIRTIQFYQPLSLGVGEYVLGSGKWPTKIQLLKVTVECRVRAGRTQSSRTVLNLELGGVLSDLKLNLQLDPGATFLKTVRSFPNGASGRIIAANTEMRWKCVEGPAAVEDLGFDWLVTVMYQAAGAESPSQPFTVAWVNGAENRVLYDYDPVALTFTERTPGVSSGRAVVQGGSNFRAQFVDQPVSKLAMQATTAGLRVNRLIANGGVATHQSPRLEFWIGIKRVATLTREGELRVNKALEPAAGFPGVSGGLDRFAFQAAGNLRAVLGGAGTSLQGGWLIEPVESGSGALELILVDGQMLLQSNDGTWHWVYLKQVGGKPHEYVEQNASTPPYPGLTRLVLISPVDGLSYPVSLKTTPHPDGSSTVALSPGDDPVGDEGLPGVTLKSDDGSEHVLSLEVVNGKNHLALD